MTSQDRQILNAVICQGKLNWSFSYVILSFEFMTSIVQCPAMFHMSCEGVNCCEAARSISGQFLRNSHIETHNWTLTYTLCDLNSSQMWWNHRGQQRYVSYIHWLQWNYSTSELHIIYRLADSKWTPGAKASWKLIRLWWKHLEQLLFRSTN